MNSWAIPRLLRLVSNGSCLPLRVWAEKNRVSFKKIHCDNRTQAESDIKDVSGNC